MRRLTAFLSLLVSAAAVATPPPAEETEDVTTVGGKDSVEADKGAP